MSKSTIDINIKYFDGPDDKVQRLQQIEKGNWIDLYAAKDIFVPLADGSPNMKPTLIPLGIGMQLPPGYEAHLASRSSTFKNWGIVQTNPVGIIDESYSGDNDQWMFAAICISPREIKNIKENKDFTPGALIRKGDKICQFRIMESQPHIEFHEVEHLNDTDRGGFGSTGTK